MDYSRIYKGDTILFQGQHCAYKVKRGDTVISEPIKDYPRHFSFVDNNGVRGVATLGYSWVKIKGT